MFNMLKSRFKNILVIISFPCLLSSCFVKKDQGKGVVDDDTPALPVFGERYFDIEDDEGADTKEYTEAITLTTDQVKDKVLGGWLGHVYGLGSGFEYVIAKDKTDKYLYGNESTPNATSGETTISYTGTAGTVKGLFFENSIIGLDDEYFETDGRICTGSLGSNRRSIAPVSSPRVISGNVFSDDDINVDVLNQFIFRDYGPLLSNQDLVDAWKYYDVHDLGGGKYAKQVMDSGYIAPFTGTAQYGNEAYWNTEGWIENETLGLLFPYMYDSCFSYADMFTHLQSDGDTTYLGILSALMYALAYEYSDTKQIMEVAFNYLPHSNMVYEMYQYVKTCYENDVRDNKDLNKAWRNTCLGVANRYALVSNHCGDNDKVSYSINACAGMIFTSLFYGENDFQRTLKIVSLCGLDGDCTAATVGGLMGIIAGYDNLPANYKNFLNKDSYYCNVTPHNRGTQDGHISLCGFTPDFGYMDKHFPNTITFNELANLTIQNMEKLVVAFGGNVNGSNIRIMKQPVRTSSNSVNINNYSFESGTVNGWHFVGSTGASISIADAPDVSHIGKRCGVIYLGEVTEDSTNTATLSQELTLEEGHEYSYSVWIKGGPDREVHLFAKDRNGKQFKSIVNNKGLEYSKLSFSFIATSDCMEVGIDYPKSISDAVSNVIYVDDAQIVDLANYKQRIHRSGFECEEIDYEGAVEKKNVNFSNGKALKFDSEYVAEINLDLDNLSGIKTFKIFYQNKEEDYAKFAVSLDDDLVTYLDLLPTGIVNTFSESNCFEFSIFVPKDVDTIKFQIIDGLVYLDGLIVEDESRALYAYAS